jgi:hypothetical protein
MSHSSDPGHDSIVEIMSAATKGILTPGSLGASEFAGKVARAALALLLFAQGAVLALMGIGWALLEFSRPDLLEVPYPAWAGASLYGLLFGAAAAASSVAAVALWQVGWGRGHLVGPRKVAWVWAAVVVTALLLPGSELAIATYGINADLTTSDLLASIVVWGGMSACTALYALRKPLRWAGWKPITIAVAGVVVVVTGTAIMVHAQRQTLLDSFHNLSPRPSSNEMCAGQPNDGCASHAARMRGGVVAWIPMADTYESDFGDALLVYGHRAYEVLRSTSDSARLELFTNDGAAADRFCADGGCSHRRTVRVGGLPVLVQWGFSTESGDFAVADWSYEGFHFSLYADNLYHAVDRAWLVDVLRTVHYAHP